MMPQPKLRRETEVLINVSIEVQYSYQIFVEYFSFVVLSQLFYVLADIENAFLQVAIQESDRDVTHFLWFKDLANLHVAERNEV